MGREVTDILLLLQAYPRVSWSKGVVESSVTEVNFLSFRILGQYHLPHAPSRNFRCRRRASPLPAVRQVATIHCALCPDTRLLLLDRRRQPKIDNRQRYGRPGSHWRCHDLRCLRSDYRGRDVPCLTRTLHGHLGTDMCAHETCKLLIDMRRWR